MRNVLAVSLVVALGLFVSEPPAAAEQPTIPREGMVEVAAAEVASLVTKITKDARYEALSRVAAERGIRLEPAQAAGRDYSEGYRAVFIPAFDGKGKERGFLVESGEIWALALSLQNGKITVSEGFTAKRDDKGGITVEVSLMTRPESPDILAGTTKTVSMSCGYVRNSGFSWGCFREGNSYGQYYTVVNRWGTSPNSTTSAWWVCYQGINHDCPVNEAQGSPFITTFCGTPPAHPVG
jgi:hypothetical protein